jgi:hypothetical protein
MSRSKRRAILRALTALSKYLSVYEEGFLSQVA